MLKRMTGTAAEPTYSRVRRGTATGRPMHVALAPVSSTPRGCLQPKRAGRNSVKLLPNSYCSADNHGRLSNSQRRPAGRIAYESAKRNQENYNDAINKWYIIAIIAT